MTPIEHLTDEQRAVIERAADFVEHYRFYDKDVSIFEGLRALLPPPSRVGPVTVTVELSEDAARRYASGEWMNEGEPEFHEGINALGKACREQLTEPPRVGPGGISESDTRELARLRLQSAHAANRPAIDACRRFVAAWDAGTPPPWDPEVES